MLNEFEKDSKALKTTLLKMCWYMRGGMSLEEAWTLGPQDRELVSELIKDNLKTTEETKLPFF
jgi:hypothetical protein